MTAEKFLNRLPKFVIRQGEVIDIRGPIRDTLQVSPALAPQALPCVCVCGCHQPSPSQPEQWLIWRLRLGGPSGWPAWRDRPLTASCSMVSWK